MNIPRALVMVTFSRQSHLLFFVVQYLIDNYTGAQNSNVIFTIDDIDSIRVRPTPVGFTNSGDRFTSSFEGVFVLPERAVDFVVVWAGNIQSEFFIEPAELFDNFGE